MTHPRYNVHLVRKHKFRYIVRRDSHLFEVNADYHRTLQIPLIGHR